MTFISYDEEIHLKQFFNAVTSVDNYNLLELRLIGSDKPIKVQYCKDLNSAMQIISKVDSDINIYYGMASRKDSTSGTKSNCRSLKCLYLDIDYGNEGHKKESIFPDKESALNFIQSLPFPEPSTIVGSGNGLHLYWLLDKEIVLEEKIINKLETLMKDIGVLYGADSTQDVSRVFRVPFTINNKGTDKKKCEIIRANYDLKYSIENLRDNALLKLQLSKIKTAKNTQHNYYEGILGKTDSWDTDDRSRIDQSLITFLVNSGYTDDEIQLIFDSFTTTGKYKGNNSGQAYLSHSITKSRNNKQPYNEKKKNMNEAQNHFKCEESGPEIGYYEKDNSGNYNRLTNFIVRLGYWVTKERDKNIMSFYPGEAITENKIYPFPKIETQQLIDSNAFKKFFYDLCGTRIFINKPAAAMDAIRYFNRDINELQECEFGYTSDLTEYITEGYRIKKDKIENVYTPIRYSENWKNNSLGFEILNPDETEKLIYEMIDSYITIQDLSVTLPSLAFALYPVIYEALKDINPKKFYLFLCGTSGSGKSVVAKFLQSLYGNFPSLFSCTSTGTSISVTGTAFKDALLVLDDIKATNFKSEKDFKNFMITLQNYSDLNGRQRCRIDLTLMDERIIKGHLLLTGEDVPFSESSTLARGLSLHVPTQNEDYKTFSKFEELSKRISGIVPFYIQTLMKSYTMESITEIFINCRNKILDFNLKGPGVSSDNLSRAINNGAALYTSWEILSKILLIPRIGDRYQDIFPNLLKNILYDNLKRINSYRQDEMFEDLLWEMLQSKKLKLRHFNSYGQENTYFSERTVIGTYSVDVKNNIELIISLKSALKEIKKDAPELNISYETLKKKLLTENKIFVNSSERFRVGGHLQRGVKWIGNIPKSIFDIDENDPIDQTYDILDNESKEKSNEELSNSQIVITKNLDPVEDDFPRNIFDIKRFNERQFAANS